jgi:hypothetical protein
MPLIPMSDARVRIIVGSGLLPLRSSFRPSQLTHGVLIGPLVSVIALRDCLTRAFGFKRD